MFEQNKNDSTYLSLLIVKRMLQVKISHFNPFPAE